MCASGIAIDRHRNPMSAPTYGLAAPSSPSPSAPYSRERRERPPDSEADENPALDPVRVQTAMRRELAACASRWLRGGIRPRVNHGRQRVAGLGSGHVNTTCRAPPE